MAGRRAKKTPKRVGACHGIMKTWLSNGTQGPVTRSRSRSMAATLVMSTSSAEAQKIHPFFVRTQSTQKTQPIEEPLPSTGDVLQPRTAPDAVEVTHPTTTHSRKRKGGNTDDNDDKHDSSVSDRRKVGKRIEVAAVKTPMNSSLRDEDDCMSQERSPSSSSRKRRKSSSASSSSSAIVVIPRMRDVEDAKLPRSSPPSAVSSREVQVSQSPVVMVHQRTRSNITLKSQSIVVPETSSLPSTPVRRQSAASSSDGSRRSTRSSSKVSTRKKHPAVSPIKASPPKKMLRLNNSGKFSSPVRKDMNSKPIEESKTGRGSKKRPRIKKQRLIAVLSYRNADGEKKVAIGTKIDQILGSNTAVKQEAIIKPGGPLKPTHPFFLGKSALKAQQGQSPAKISPHSPQAGCPRPRKAAITPGKLRAEARLLNPPIPLVGFGRPNASSSFAATPRYPGSVDAPWPWQGLTRILPEDEEICPVAYKLNSQMLFPSRRKGKEKILLISDSENIMLKYTDSLNEVAAFHDGQLEGDRNRISPTLRIPTRLLTTSPKMQRMVHQQLSGDTVLQNMPDPSALSENPEDIDTLRPTKSSDPHPALVSMYNGLLKTLTAFDKGTCEYQAWTQKYAPSSASEVLQSSEQVMVLHEWLRNSVVSTVETVTREDKAMALASKSAKPTKKKRKRANDIDDFIVDEDEILDGNRAAVHKNITLLTGPHGSGKTAAVYAVAKELGFEIFEIGPGSRRSGRDILDRVGDMTANHLVQGGSKLINTDPTTTDDEATLRNSAALQRDLESGRQGTMKTFFKSMGVKPKSNPKISPSKSSNGRKAVAKSQKSILPPKPSRQQKQSLILLEEVDVLFEEDKQFWATVLTLAQSSKRPIIMTCTHESFLPLNILPLHAKLDFRPAPLTLAADYLLLLAAREGHMLKRESISTLYKSRNKDLRASISDLNLWCQMAVGDRKGGLEWMYQRWPRGSDIDDEGQTLRVASQDTYVQGMGWVGRDIFFAPEHSTAAKQTNLLGQAWEFWGLDATGWRHGNGNFVVPNTDKSSEKETRKLNLQDLQDFGFLLDGISAADTFCCRELPSRGKHIFDASLPELSATGRSDYVTGRTLLQDEPVAHYCDLAKEMTIETHFLVSKINRSKSIFGNGFGEDTVTDEILNCLIGKRKINKIDRGHFADAFDPLAWEPSATASFGSMFTASSFDRPFEILTTDLAPYVRSIVAYDQRLEALRMKMSNMLSAGGAKRARTTRAARSALEGGSRNETRRERWFDISLELNFASVMKTAGPSWSGMGGRLMGKESEDAQSVKSGGSRDIVLDDIAA